MSSSKLQGQRDICSGFLKNMVNIWNWWTTKSSVGSALVSQEWNMPNIAASGYVISEDPVLAFIQDKLIEWEKHSKQETTKQQITVFMNWRKDEILENYKMKKDTEKMSWNPLHLLISKWLQLEGTLRSSSSNILPWADTFH